MTKTIKTITYTSVGLLLALALLVPQVFATHSWADYHWARTASTFDLQVQNSMTPEWQDSLTGAVTDWSASSVLNLVLIDGNGKRSCRGKDGYIEACNAEYGNNGWLGLAQIWVSGDHITKGTAKMNDTYYSDSYAGGYYNTPAWKNLVVCQEIAHAFGLGHQDENFSNANLDTCMDYTSSPESNQQPNAHDFDMLEDIYAHTDTFNSYAEVSSGGDTGGNGNGNKGGGRGKPQGIGQDINLDNPSEWGEVVKEDAQGNPSVYVRTLPSGESVVTHVTWIEGYNAHDHE